MNHESRIMNGCELAQPEFLNLPGRRHWKFTSEPDEARNLVGCYLSFAEVADLLLSCCRPFLETDPRTDLFAILAVGNTDHRHLADRRMGVQELLDLARKDVLAAPDNHVLDAADNLCMAVVTQNRDVSCVHPTGFIDRGARALGVVPVTVHHHVATHAQLTGSAARDDSPGFGIDDLALHVRQHRADRMAADLEVVV